ncbi:MAG TPA: 2-C-methyl-D-erythritol 4-phosphate cytidylyltransferase, partial [Azospira sp.]|nr:2-C-methyl-D-erythritol 4-phosphate cytidylyltransferase [Azospira sp.]
FRYGTLRQALEANREVTDEAGAVESLGLVPRLVKGDACNLKVTYPADLSLAEAILRSRLGPRATLGAFA